MAELYLHVSVELGGGGFWGYVGWWLSHPRTPSRLPDHTRGQMLRTGSFYVTAPERRQESLHRRALASQGVMAWGARADTACMLAAQLR